MLLELQLLNYEVLLLEDDRWCWCWCNDNDKYNESLAFDEDDIEHTKHF